MNNGLKRRDKIDPETKINILFDLIESFRSLKSSKEAADFLGDLLTANEIKNIAVRLRIAKLLLKGLSQRSVCAEIHSSLGTVNKVNIWLEEGGEGFKKILSRLPLKWEKPAKLPKGPIEFHLPEIALGMVECSVVRVQESNPRRLIGQMSRKTQIGEQLKEENSQTYSK